MEFSNLGSHCSINNCYQQDFLPFQCDACRRTYCKDHRAYSEHSCAHVPMGEEVVKCPVCSKGITRLPGIDINLTISQHMDSSECSKVEASRCPKCKTRLTDINTIVCNRCRQKVCVSHRYSDQHECTHPLERKVNAMGFNCTRCNTHFSKSIDLIQHMRKSH
jgi:uncharacterized C2H2 Zn-finger protein